MFFYENKYFDIPINCQLDLFDKVINPILPQTVWYTVYGETGSLYPLSLFMKIRILLCTGRKKTDECTYIINVVVIELTTNFIIFVTIEKVLIPEIL